VSSLKLSIRFFTTLREITGKREEELEFRMSDVRVKDALDKLTEMHGREFKEYVYNEEGNVRDHLQLLVNGKSVRSMDQLDTLLKEGDQLAIVPPVGGG
jgi:molybdopterin synthase sulfur carrier subunit